MVEYRPLGRTDIRLYPLALGTMTWGQQNTEQEAHAQLDYAVERGVNLIDTAEIYSIPPRAETQGSTERIIGNWLGSRGKRDKIVLATKVTGRSNADWLRPGGETPQLDRKNITYALEQSLKRLQTDYIDLYQLHSPDRSLPLFAASTTTWPARNHSDAPEIPIEETLHVLGDLVRQGKIRHVGVSNETAWGAGRFLFESERNPERPRIVSIQNAYNLLNRTFEIGLAETAVREDVGLLAYSPLAQGFLTGKYQNGARPPNARLTLFDRGQRYQKPGVHEAVEAYLALAREFGLDAAQLALAFVTSRPFVTANILGTTSLAQLTADLDSLDVTITPELEARINAIHQRFSNPAP